MRTIIVAETDGKRRLDRYLKKYLAGASLGFIYKAIRKDIKVNGKRKKSDYQVSPGDEISIYIDDKTLEEITRTKKMNKAKKQFEIAYEDDKIIVVEKPFGLLTHGDEKEKKNTLVNQVQGYLAGQAGYVAEQASTIDDNNSNDNNSPEKSDMSMLSMSGITFNPAPANRLDRNTTGLVIFGKTHASMKALNKMIKDGMVDKYYLTIVSGKVTEDLYLKSDAVKDEHKNKLNILPNSADIKGTDINSVDNEFTKNDNIINRGLDNMAVKNLETIVRPVRSGDDFSLVEVELVTGRTHQIRAHLAHVGHPIIGDRKYGDPEINKMVADEFQLTTQLLHSYKLIFREAVEPIEYMEGCEIVTDKPNIFRKIEKTMF